MENLGQGSDQIDGKVKRRKENILKLNLEIKSIRGELRKIQSEITPKLVKDTCKHLENKDTEPLVRCLEALVGTLRNTEKCSNIDVELYLKTHEGLTFKMNRVDPA
jgi:hypothetical protein